MSILPGIYASQITGHLVTTAYESIQTVNVGIGGTTSISFSSIPSTYKHLQIRAIARFTRADIYGSGKIRFNSDATASNYISHLLEGSGSSASAGVYTTTTGLRSIEGSATNAPSGVFGVNVYDILDYTNTNKYKTMRGISGVDENTTGGDLRYYSGLWMNTAAISSIQIEIEYGTLIEQYSSFALYGIRG